MRDLFYTCRPYFFKNIFVKPTLVGMVAAAAEELLKTLDINQTCKKYYHIYARLPRPGPSHRTQPGNILFGRED